MIKTSRLNKEMVVLSVIIALLIVLTSSSVYARNVANITNFRVRSIRERYVSFLVKTKNNSNYVLNLKQATGRNNVVIKSRMYNSNGEKRSDWGETREGSRNTHVNTGVRNYKYRLGLVRQYVWDGEITVNGSWSPDDR